MADNLPSFFQKLPDEARATLIDDFREKAFNLNADKHVRHEFSNGNYSFTQTPELKTLMTEIGQQVLQLAGTHNIDLRNTAEFRGADFDRNGQLSAEEVGAIMMAGNMGARIPQHSRALVVSTFDSDGIDRSSLERLSSGARDQITAIARQLLGDNGVRIAGESTTTAEADRQFTQQMQKDPNTSPARC